MSLAVSPDGRQLAFAKLMPMTINLLPTTGGEPRQLLKVQRPDRIYRTAGIAWTPDGRSVLFAKKRGGPKGPNPELWQVPVDGGAAQNLGLAMDGLRHLSLHPDGRRIAFTAGQQTSEVWMIENFLPSLAKAR